MTRRQLRGRGLAIACVFAVFGVGALQAQDCEDVSGVWDVTVGLPGGNTQDVVLTLEQAGCELTGLIKGDNETPIADGTVSGWTFTFNTTVEGNGLPFALTWEGTVDGDSVSGTWGGGPVGTLEFSGTRAEG